MDRRKRYGVLTALLLLASVCFAQPADVDQIYNGMVPVLALWDEVTTDVNGDPLLDTDVITYRAYYAPAPGTDDPVFIAEVALPEATVDLSGLPRGYYYLGVSAVGTTAEGAVDESAIAWSNDPVAVGPTQRSAWLVTGTLYLAPPSNLSFIQ